MAQLKPLSACQYQGWLANSMALCRLQRPRPLRIHFTKGAVCLSVCDEAGMCFTKTVCFNHDRDSVVEKQMRNKHFLMKAFLALASCRENPLTGDIKT